MRAGRLRLVGSALLTTCVAVGALAAPAAAANPQTISFAPLSNKLIGSAPFNVSATTSAGDSTQSVIHGFATDPNKCTVVSNLPC